MPPRHRAWVLGQVGGGRDSPDHSRGFATVPDESTQTSAILVNAGSLELPYLAVLTRFPGAKVNTLMLKAL